MYTYMYIVWIQIHKLPKIYQYQSNGTIVIFFFALFLFITKSVDYFFIFNQY